MTNGGSIVALDFDNSITAWPIYDWMGVCKAALEATVRYLARDLGPKGIRVNSLAAGPLATIAAKGIPGFKSLEQGWGSRPPWGGARRTAMTVVARTACALLSDWLPSTTGELVHVDGGYHAIGAPPGGSARRAVSGRGPARGRIAHGRREPVRQPPERGRSDAAPLSPSGADTLKSHRLWQGPVRGPRVRSRGCE